MSKSSDLAALKSAFQKGHKFSPDGAKKMADLCYDFFDAALKGRCTLVEANGDRANPLNEKGSFAPLTERIARGCDVGYIEADGKTVQVFVIE